MAEDIESAIVFPMQLPDLTHLAVPGTFVSVKATPKASRARIEIAQGILRVYVTEPPDKGRANDAVRKLLAKAMGIAKGRLELTRGAASREKQFRVI